MLLGCIADDFTGATDLALMLQREGMRTIQTIGVPTGTLPDADAVVIALKSRTIPAADAVRLSLESLDFLLAQGAKQIFFKYCSTFDSTDAGNIGPVAEALLARLDAPIAIACPAFPTNARTIYQGHLFVGSQLLSDSPMRHHPLTPMQDSNLVRVLQRQTKLPVGLIPFAVVDRGAEAIRTALQEAAGRGERMVITDAVTDTHLRAIGAALADAKLITGGSGVALGLPENFRRAGLLTADSAGAGFAAPRGRAAILAGSCSAATQQQVAIAEQAGVPALRLTPAALADGSQDAARATDWAKSQKADGPVLIYSTATPEEVKAAQQQLGTEKAASLVEGTLAATARALVEGGFSRIIVAGGETSGAVVEALGVKALEIGPEIDPGVPWTRSLSQPEVALALKSGNFGAKDFFLKAWGLLP